MRWEQLFRFVVVSSLMLLVSSGETNTTSTLKPAVERVFSRKKRFLLFPKGSYLKFTCSLGKHLLSSYPRGAGFTLEAALYYPVPGHRDDLYPKRLRKPTTTTPKPTGTTEPTFVYIPGTDLRFKAKPVSKPKPLKLHRIDDAPVSWSDTKSSLEYNNPSKWAQWSKYGEKYASWTPSKTYEQYEHPWQPASQSKWAKWTTPSSKWNKWSTSSPKWTNYYNKWDTPEKRWRRTDSTEKTEQIEEFDPYDYPDMDHLLDWRHYHAHRDRRQLFDHFGGLSQLFGIDMKHCILRAMCESKRLLLPPGYSMLQDIMRVILTMPTISGLEDDYSRIMRMDNEGCAAALKGKCNISLIAWLLGSKWHSTITEPGA